MSSNRLVRPVHMGVGMGARGAKAPVALPYLSTAAGQLQLPTDLHTLH